METTFEKARGLLPERPAQGHKGTFGHVFILAGSRGFTGAAKLAALAAGRSGAGLVTVGTPRPLADIMAVSPARGDEPAPPRHKGGIVRLLGGGAGTGLRGRQAGRNTRAGDLAAARHGAICAGIRAVVPRATAARRGRAQCGGVGPGCTEGSDGADRGNAPSRRDGAFERRIDGRNSERPRGPCEGVRGTLRVRGGVEGIGHGDRGSGRRALRQSDGQLGPCLRRHGRRAGGGLSAG